jgi:hypothetical protein
MLRKGAEKPRLKSAPKRTVWQLQLRQGWIEFPSSYEVHNAFDAAVAGRSKQAASNSPTVPCAAANQRGHGAQPGRGK